MYVSLQNKIFYGLQATMALKATNTDKCGYRSATYKIDILYIFKAYTVYIYCKLEMFPEYFKLFIYNNLNITIFDYYCRLHHVLKPMHCIIKPYKFVSFGLILW